MSDVTVGLVQRRRRSRVEAEQLVAEFEASGETRQAFCSDRGLSVAALDKYRRAHGRAMTGQGSRMVPVEVVGGFATPAVIEGGSALWLELANGCRIAVGSGFDAATLKRLVAVLAEA